MTSQDPARHLCLGSLARISLTGHERIAKGQDQVTRLSPRLRLPCLLLKAECFRQLYKASDIVFDVPVGTWFWPALMFEPLIIGISFPFLSNPLWQLRSTPKTLHLGR
jgi:hypothetical protein